MTFDKDLINEIGTKLKNKNESVSIAESASGGLLQAAFSNAESASLFFQGGITAYNIGQKCRHLMVEPIQAQNCDCVSEDVAATMSKSVCNMFLSNYGISITGYATRIPEKEINNLFAFYAIAQRDKILGSGRITTEAADGLPAQLSYINSILKIFNDLI